MGPALAIPTSIMSFAMTSIFVCLLVGQRWGLRTAVVAVTAAVAVIALKALGAGSLAVLLGALAGVGAGLALGAVRGRGGDEG